MAWQTHPRVEGGGRLHGQGDEERGDAGIFRFNRCGQSGIEIAETFPNLARHADDLCVIRSMQAAATITDPPSSR